MKHHKFCIILLIIIITCNAILFCKTKPSSIGKDKMKDSETNNFNFKKCEEMKSYNRETGDARGLWVFEYFKNDPLSDFLNIELKSVHRYCLEISDDMKKGTIFLPNTEQKYQIVIHKISETKFSMEYGNKKRFFNVVKFRYSGNAKQFFYLRFFFDDINKYNPDEGEAQGYDGENYYDKRLENIYDCSLEGCLEWLSNKNKSDIKLEEMDTEGLGKNNESYQTIEEQKKEQNIYKEIYSDDYCDNETIGIWMIYNDKKIKTMKEWYNYDLKKNFNGYCVEITDYSGQVKIYFDTTGKYYNAKIKKIAEGKYYLICGNNKRIFNIQRKGSSIDIDSNDPFIKFIYFEDSNQYNPNNKNQNPDGEDLFYTCAYRIDISCTVEGAFKSMKE